LKYLNNYTVTENDTITFTYKISEGTRKFTRIYIGFLNNLGSADYTAVLSADSEGLPLEGSVSVKISDSSLQSGFTYSIRKVRIFDEKFNEVVYYGSQRDDLTNKITNMVTGKDCSIKHNFFDAGNVFEIKN